MHFKRASLVLGRKNRRKYKKWLKCKGNLNSRRKTNAFSYATHARGDTDAKGINSSKCIVKIKMKFTVEAAKTVR